MASGLNFRQQKILQGAVIPASFLTEKPSPDWSSGEAVPDKKDGAASPVFFVWNEALSGTAESRSRAEDTLQIFIN